uniref:Metallo-beta-lactamase domain-containing protein n=1 Tax=Alexandrium catenella TaxID=2925 RepID=A0A7S1R4Z7_ALECA
MSSTLLLATGVAGVLRIAGRSWHGLPMTPTSLGPWGYAVMEGQSTALIDVPYYSEDLVKELKRIAPHGVSHLLFTHDDFVGMSRHASWKVAFPRAIRIAHSADCRPQGSLEVELSGSGPWEVAGLRAYHVPGHSKGSVFYASPGRSAVFTGDSAGLWDDLWGGLWGGRPNGFGMFNRFGRANQAKSLRGYARSAPFCKAVLPGHGLPAYFKDERELAAFFEAAADSLDGGERGR